ncbi:MAG TPA: hypothetical protein VKA68_09075 [bacterium]|nr:hypothetical protein [bacterium]
MHKKITIIVVLALAILAGCYIENPTQLNFPTWSVNLEVPLLKQTIYFDDILSDTVLTTTALEEGSSDSVFAFQKAFDIDSVIIDEQLDYNEVQKSRSKAIDTISLAPPAPFETESFAFRDIMPSSIIDPIETALSSQDTVTTIIVEKDLQTQTKSISFNSFRRAVISDGFLDITVHNNMFIPLGAPITVILENSEGSIIDSVEFTNRIPTNGDETQSLDISGKVFTGDITVSVTGHSEGSDGPVDITQKELASGFSITAEIHNQGDNLKVTSATAQIPGQTIQDADTVALQADTKVEQAVLNTGMLTLDIANNLELNADLHLTVHSLVDEFGTPFQLNLDVPASSQVNRQSDLSAYTLQMPISQQEIPYSYTVNTEDTGENFATVASDDSVELDIQMGNLTFEELTGTIAPQTVDFESVEQELTELPEDLRGIELQNVDMILDVDTDVDIPVFLDMKLISVNSAGESDSLEVTNHNITENPQVIFENAAPLLNLFPEKIFAVGTATIGEEGHIGTVTRGQYVTGELNITAPFQFNIAENPRVELDPELVDEELPEQVEGMQLFALMENAFEIGASVEIYAAKDTTSFEDDSPDSSLGIFTIAADSASLDSLVLDQSDVSLFQKPVYIKTIVNMMGKNGSETSQILSTDSLQITLYGKAQYLNDQLHNLNDDSTDMAEQE